ncbi:MAG: hypothetical protein HYS12_29185 [Planctomycetes bacterium]|nr:hypothetical protein [Planctomycetota bacterium]
MTKVICARVDPNGVLTLTVPFDKAEANKPVRVTVQTIEEAPPLDREAWLRFLEQTAGSITDPTFERPPQGEYEERDALP